MRKICGLVLCVALVVALAVPASASMQYTYIDTVSATLRIDEFWGIASCSGAVDSIDSNAMDVYVYLMVYKNGQWETLKTWTNSGQYFVSAGGDYAIARGYQYQTYVVGYAYDENGNIAESASVSDYMYY